jgi:hypothetical protein
MNTSAKYDEVKLNNTQRGEGFIPSLLDLPTLGYSVTSTERSKDVQNNNESDATIIARREKQIEYGKKISAYERYCKQVCKEDRTVNMPTTPEIHKKYSRNKFDKLVKLWKIEVHNWDDLFFLDSFL